MVREELRRLLSAVGASDEVIWDVELACGEACGNAVDHPLVRREAGLEVKARVDTEQVRVMVRDFGLWREETNRRDHHAGVGFTLMQALMDDIRYRPTASGTFVRLSRSLSADEVWRQAQRSTPEDTFHVYDRGTVEARTRPRGPSHFVATNLRLRSSP